MNKNKFLLLLLVILAFENCIAQNLKIFHTHELLNIARVKGVDSALAIAVKFPVYFIDEPVADSLVAMTLDADVSYLQENFLCDYAVSMGNPTKVNDAMLVYLEKRNKQIKTYKPDENFGLPSTSRWILGAFMRITDSKLEKLLIECYEEWAKKSLEYLESYKRGKTMRSDRNSYNLKRPYMDCNANCCLVLLALKSIGSPYFDKSKLDRHNEVLTYKEERPLGITFSTRTAEFMGGLQIAAIRLKRNYKSLIDPELSLDSILQIFTHYQNNTDKECWSLLLHNGSIGFIDTGCYYGELNGGGSIFRIELHKKVLLIYSLMEWVSLIN